MVLAMKALEGPNAQETAERLKVATSHSFNDVKANFHAPGIAGEVARKSSITQWAFGHLWRNYGVDLTCASSAVSS